MMSAMAGRAQMAHSKMGCTALAFQGLHQQVQLTCCPLADADRLTPTPFLAIP
jgi:hypothetical protein